MMWTPIERKLPAQGEYVLVAFGDGSVEIAALADEEMQTVGDELWQKVWWSVGGTVFGATHWMPLPDNPNAEDANA